MPYTLSMALLWVALAILLGIVVGWLMRSVVANLGVTVDASAAARHASRSERSRSRSDAADSSSAACARSRSSSRLSR